MKLFLTILLALLYSSFIEYCLHRFLLHRSYKEEHIQVHHKVFHGIKSYQLDEINRGDVLLNTEELMRNALFYLVPAIPIFMLNKTLGIVFFSVSFLYNVWEEFVHLNFHKKTDIFIVNLKFFQNLKEHHRVHHYIYNSNFGIGTSFWDIMFRTKKQG